MAETQTQVPDAIQELITRGARKVVGEFNPMVTLTNKEGTPGAFLTGRYIKKRIVDVERKKGSKVEMQSTPIYTFELKGTNAPLSINNGGLFTDVPVEKYIGKNVDLWGAGQLNYLMAQVSESDEVGIMYQGKKEVEGYPEPLHQFDLINLPSMNHHPAEKAPF